MKRTLLATIALISSLGCAVAHDTSDSADDDSDVRDAQAKLGISLSQIRSPY